MHSHASQLAEIRARVNSPSLIIRSSCIQTCLLHVLPGLDLYTVYIVSCRHTIYHLPEPDPRSLLTGWLCTRPGDLQSSPPLPRKIKSLALVS